MMSKDSRGFTSGHFYGITYATPIDIETIIKTVDGMIRKPPYKDEDFDSGWNNALFALMDELGFGDIGIDFVDTKKVAKELEDIL